MNTSITRIDIQPGNLLSFNGKTIEIALVLEKESKFGFKEFPSTSTDIKYANLDELNKKSIGLAITENIALIINDPRLKQISGLATPNFIFHITNISRKNIYLVEEEGRWYFAEKNSSIKFFDLKTVQLIHEVQNCLTALSNSYPLIE